MCTVESSKYGWNMARKSYFHRKSKSRVAQHYPNISYLWIQLVIMSKAVKIYKPTEEEILKNVLDSFAIENIQISYDKAKESYKKVLARLKKESE